MSIIMCKEKIKETKLRQAEWLNNQVVTEILLISIKLSNPIHKFAKTDLSKEINRLKENVNPKIINPIVVKYNEKDNRYHLISGLKGYHLVKAIHQEYIPAIIVDYDRYEYCKQVGINDKLKFGWRNISSIIIPTKFINNGVCEWKIQKCIDYYNKYEKMDKPVILRNRVCLDGYSRLVASQHLGLDRVFVQYI